MQLGGTTHAKDVVDAIGYNIVRAERTKDVVKTNAILVAVHA